MRLPQVSPLKGLKTVCDAGYSYMLMPDHAPAHPDDQSPDGSSGRIRHGWAFQFGYIASVIQAVKRSRGLGWEEIRTPQPQPLAKI